MAQSRLVDWQKKLPFWLLVIFFVLIFLTGGSSRPDVSSLVILRPTSVIICGLGLWTLEHRQFKTYRFLFIMGVAVFLLTGLQLIALPAFLWHLLPHRDLIMAIDNASDLPSAWRSISMVPVATINALYSLIVPLAILVLGVQLSREQQFKFLLVLLALGLVSGLLGLLQAVGNPTGPLYFYRISNFGSAVGLFANRNHQAIMLAMLFPMLAVFASTDNKSTGQASFKGWLAMAVAFVLLPLLLITGSRAGLLIGVLAIILSASMYRRSKIGRVRKAKAQGRHFDAKILIPIFGVFGIAVLTVMMSRAEALDRLIYSVPFEVDRLDFWPVVVKIAANYFPIGSGAGSFAEVYRVGEQADMLTQQYINQSHNDFLHILLTTGLPGVILLLISLLALATCLSQIWTSRGFSKKEHIYATLGAAILIIVILASVGDYPVHTPIHISILTIAALWLTNYRNIANRGSVEQVKKDGITALSPLTACR